MNEGLNKKMADVLARMDEKVLKAKLNAALEMLQKGNSEELAKKIKKIDKEDLLKKVNEFDESKLKELKIDQSQIKQNVSQEDLDRLSTLIGEHGDEIIEKFKKMFQL